MVKLLNHNQSTAGSSPTIALKIINNAYSLMDKILACEANDESSILSKRINKASFV